jgi:hypothetical protein
VAAGELRAGVRLIRPWQLEEAMRAETESVVNDIRESLALLRRHL